VQVLLKERLPERELWLLIRRDLAKIPRVSAVADYLAMVFRRERKVWRPASNCYLVLRVAQDDISVRSASTGGAISPRRQINGVVMWV
jgi:hypothetical protein